MTKLFYVWTANQGGVADFAGRNVQHYWGMVGVVANPILSACGSDNRVDGDASRRLIMREGEKAVLEKIKQANPSFEIDSDVYNGKDNWGADEWERRVKACEGILWHSNNYGKACLQEVDWLANKPIYEVDGAGRIQRCTAARERFIRSGEGEKDVAGDGVAIGLGIPGLQITIPRFW